MRKLLIGICVVLMASSIAFGGYVVPRTVDLGAPLNPNGTRLAYAQGMSNDLGSQGQTIVQGRSLQYKTDMSGESQEAMVWSVGGGASPAFYTNSLPDQNGLLGRDGGEFNCAFHVSADRSQVGGGYGTVINIAENGGNNTWATSSTVALNGSAWATWNTPDFGGGSNAIGGTTAGGAPATWANPGAAPVAVGGLSGFTDISASGRYVLGPATAGGYAVRDTLAGITHALPGGATINAVTAISGNGEYVIGRNQSVSTNKNTRRLAVWKWNSGTGAYDAPQLIGGSRTEPIDISDGQSPSRFDGFLILSNYYTTKNGVTTLHPAGAYTNELHPTGVRLTIAQSQTYWGNRITWAGVWNFAAGEYPVFQDGGEASPNALSAAGQIYGGAYKKAYFTTLPEPATLSLLLIGSVALLRRRR